MLVVDEGFQRRDIEDCDPAILPCSGRAEKRQEGRLRLSSGSRRRDEDVAAVTPNGRDSARLDFAQLRPALRTHPALDLRMQSVERCGMVRE